MDVEEAIAAKSQLEPYLLLVQEDHNIIFLVIDNKILDQIQPRDLPFCLMAAYYVFNIQYPKACHMFYSFLEVFVLKMEPGKASTIKHFLARLKAL